MEKIKLTVLISCILFLFTVLFHSTGMLELMAHDSSIDSSMTIAIEDDDPTPEPTPTPEVDPDPEPEPDIEPDPDPEPDPTPEPPGDDGY